MNIFKHPQEYKYILIVIVLVLAAGVWAFMSLFAPRSEKRFSSECKQIEQEIDTLIQKATYCEVNSDCVVAGYVPGKPPCTCLYAVNQDFGDPSELENSTTKWVTTCMEPDLVCEACGPPALSAKCQENRCIGVYEQDNTTQTLQGTVRFTSLEGGCWYVQVPSDPGPLEDIEKFELLGLSEEELEQYRNQQVEVGGRIRKDMASICQIGSIFEVQEISFVGEKENNQQPGECPQGFTWSLSGQACVGVCPGEYCDLDKSIPF